MKKGIGLLNEKQFQVLRLRAKGLSQLETAKQLGTTRANVSMIELRARKKVQKAKETFQAYESLQILHNVIVEKGTRLHDLPSVVLRLGDRLHIHIQSNLVEIIRMAKSLEPSCVRNGVLARDLLFTFNQRGKLSLAQSKNFRQERH